MTRDLPGFDRCEPSTWHPMNWPVVEALREAQYLLELRVGLNMAPAAESIARTLFPLADGATELERVRGHLAAMDDAVRHLAIERDRSRAEVERLRGWLDEALDGWQYQADSPDIDRIHAIRRALTTSAHPETSAHVSAHPADASAHREAP